MEFSQQIENSHETREPIVWSNHSNLNKTMFLCVRCAVNNVEKLFDQANDAKRSHQTHRKHLQINITKVCNVTRFTQRHAFKYCNIFESLAWWWMFTCSVRIESAAGIYRADIAFSPNCAYIMQITCKQILFVGKLQPLRYHWCFPFVLQHFFTSTRKSSFTFPKESVISSLRWSKNLCS